ncbi:MAG: hypothetical protein SVU32_02310, partial [Candidatus Nanohaloarchaea archaeon]|nr:hypothetical protein [Candidatus Nanohaloarchaea archaeon]
SPPQQAVVTQQLSNEMQVYLLLQGGPQQVGRRGLRPAVLLQYACKDCPQVRQSLIDVANEINPGGGRWVYVAPYTKMNSTVAVSAFRRVRRYDHANRTAIKSTVCQFLQNQPLACVADQLG